MKIDTSAHSLPLVITTELTEAEHRFKVLKSANLFFEILIKQIGIFYTLELLFET
jgi:hypothetical protein